MVKGEIWVSNPPAKGGHVQRGLRPALILADVTKAIAVVAPLTTSLMATRFPHTVSVAPTASNGLEQSSVALVFQLGAVDKRFLYKKIGTVEPELLQEVNEQLRTMLRL
jgi:mRNA-degrading endonuclease toxin of MazEF toxin-antitoxin module